MKFKVLLALFLLCPTLLTFSAHHYSDDDISVGKKIRRGKWKEELVLHCTQVMAPLPNTKENHFDIFDPSRRKKVGYLEIVWKSRFQVLSIIELEIDPTERRKGYGLKTLITLFRTYKARPRSFFNRYELVTSLDFGPACALYEKLGFRIDEAESRSFRKSFLIRSMGKADPETTAKLVMMTLPRGQAENFDIQEPSLPISKLNPLKPRAPLTDDKVVVGSKIKRKKWPIQLRCTKVGSQMDLPPGLPLGMKSISGDKKYYDIFLLGCPDETKIGHLETNFDHILGTMAICDFKINDQYRRKGYGLKALVTLFRGYKTIPDFGIKRYELLVHDKNASAGKLYEKLGFTIDKKITKDTEDVRRALNQPFVGFRVMTLPRDQAEVFDILEEQSLSIPKLNLLKTRATRTDDRVVVGSKIKRKKWPLQLRCTKVTKQVDIPPGMPGIPVSMKTAPADMRDYDIFLLEGSKETKVGWVQTNFTPELGMMKVNEFEIYDRHRRKGYGQRALVTLFRGYKTIPVFGITHYQLLVDRNNIPALSLYEKLGFITDTIATSEKRKDAAALKCAPSFDPQTMTLPRNNAEAFDL